MPATPVKLSPTGAPILAPDAATFVPAQPRASASRKCTADEISDGGAIVSFYLDPQTWQRLKRKMQTQDPAEFMWQEVIRRNVEGMVY